MVEHNCIRGSTVQLGKSIQVEQMMLVVVMVTVLLGGKGELGIR